MSDKTKNVLHTFLWSGLFLAVIGGAYAFGVERSYFTEKLLGNQQAISRNETRIVRLEQDTRETREKLIEAITQNNEQIKNMSNTINQINRTLEKTLDRMEAK